MNDDWKWKQCIQTAEMKSLKQGSGYCLRDWKHNDNIYAELDTFSISDKAAADRSWLENVQLEINKEALFEFW